MPDPDGVAVRSGASALLRQPGVSRFVTARSLSTLAFQIQGVSVGFQVYEITRSPLALGLVGLSQFLPMLLLTLLAGYLADNLERRRLIALCQAVQAVTACCLALEAIFQPFGVYAIFALVSISAAARACEQPTEQALLPGLVARAVFPRVIAVATSVNQACVIIGPALGGFLYGAGPAVAYGTGSVLLIFAAMAALAIPPVPRKAMPTAGSAISRIFGGLSFVISRRVILGSISLDLMTVLFGGAMALLPVFAVDVLGTDSFGLGLLRSAPAAGALLTSLVLARITLRAPGKTMFAASAAFGAFTAAFAVSTYLPLSLGLLFCLGCVNVVGVVIRNALVQMRTPDELRGRVAAVNSLFTGTSNQLGDFEAGLTAALLGPVAAVALGGGISIVIALTWMVVFPEIRKLSSL